LFYQFICSRKCLHILPTRLNPLQVHAQSHRHHFLRMTGYPWSRMIHPCSTRDTYWKFSILWFILPWINSKISSQNSKTTFNLQYEKRLNNLWTTYFLLVKCSKNNFNLISGISKSNIENLSNPPPEAQAISPSCRPKFFMISFLRIPHPNISTQLPLK